jgi:hypothetical protein
MKPEEFLPFTKDTPVIRTHFGDDAAWKKICDLIRQPRRELGYEFYAYVDFVENPNLRDISVKELLAMIPRDYAHTFLFVVDRKAIQRRDFPVLVVDLYDEPGRTFRAIPADIQGIQNNLSIANMDFYEFADRVDSDGVFRGFEVP